MAETIRNDGFVYRCRVQRPDPDETLADYLARRYPHTPAVTWSRRIAEGRVLVDGEPPGPRASARAGQQVTWHRPPWDEPHVPARIECLYRDEHLLAVNKPAGLPTLPGGGFLRQTLLARLRERDPQATPMHRLGRWTSGLVLCALTPLARAELADCWRRRKVDKRYRALAEGRPEWNRKQILSPIGPVPYPPLGTLHAVSDDGQPARSEVRVLELREGAFLCEVNIETGRAHQIRIHLAAAGHPLVGDPLYGAGGKPLAGTSAVPGDPGYLLHAWRLSFPHPADGSLRTLSAAPPAQLMSQRSQEQL